MHTRTNSLRVPTALLFATLLIGCGGRRRQVVYVQATPAPAQQGDEYEETEEGPEPDDEAYDDGDGVTVEVAPPAPFEEIAPEAPADGYAWVGGRWQWDGEQYQWEPGHWEAAPQPEYVWVNGGWIDVGGRYRFSRGRWAPRGRAPVVRYVHPRPSVVVRPGATYQTRGRGGVVVAPRAWGRGGGARVQTRERGGGGRGVVVRRRR